MAIPTSRLETRLEPDQWWASEGGSMIKWSKKKRMTYFSVLLLASPLLTVFSGGIVLPRNIYQYLTNTEDPVWREYELYRIKHAAKAAIPIYNAYYVTRDLEKDEIGSDEDEYHPYPNGEDIGDQLE